MMRRRLASALQQLKGGTSFNCPKYMPYLLGSSCYIAVSRNTVLLQHRNYRSKTPSTELIKPAADNDKHHRPCGRTRGELDSLLEKSAYGRKRGAYSAYFFKANKPEWNADVTALVKKFHIPDDDIVHRCRNCGHSIAEHGEGREENQRPQSQPQHNYDNIKSGIETKKYTVVDLPQGFVATDHYHDQGGRLETVLKYIQDVQSGDMPRGKDNKYPLIGTSGLKGIGKTELLKQVIKHLRKSKDLNATGFYVTFNGGGDGREVYLQSSGIHSLCDAFGHMLLHNCGIRDPVVTFEQSIELLRMGLGMKDDASLVICVDELSHVEECHRYARNHITAHYYESIISRKHKKNLLMTISAPAPCSS